MIEIERRLSYFSFQRIGNNPHRRRVATSHILFMVVQCRSPIAVGRGVVLFYLLKLFLPDFAAATGGGERRQHPLKKVYKYLIALCKESY